MAIIVDPGQPILYKLRQLKIVPGNPRKVPPPLQQQQHQQINDSDS